MDPYGVDEITARKWPLPKDFFDALLDPRWRGWVKAIRREMRGFEENGVFYRIPRSEMKPGKIPIKSLEIFSHKNKHGKLSRFKYRHAARGDMLRALRAQGREVAVDVVLGDGTNVRIKRIAPSIGVRLLGHVALEGLRVHIGATLQRVKQVLLDHVGDPGGVADTT